MRRSSSERRESDDERERQDRAEYEAWKDYQRKDSVIVMIGVMIGTVSILAEIIIGIARHVAKLMTDYY